MARYSAAAHYDGGSVLLHWTIAIAIIGLFASGVWMVDLGYYDNWYYKAPWWHKSIGVVTALLIVLRIVWSFLRRPISAIGSIPHWQRWLATAVHHTMTLLAVVLILSGYLVVTAKGDGLSVFDWFSIPAVFTDLSAQVDTFGAIHLWAGYGIIGLALLHALAAIKHHVLDKDDTLRRMFGTHSGKGETE